LRRKVARKTLCDFERDGATGFEVKKFGDRLSGVVWNARRVVDEAPGTCLRATVMVNGRRRKKAMIEDDVVSDE
jgi:hypothetical protein